MVNHGCYIDAKSNPGYTPKTGDLIFLNYSGNPNGNVDHVAVIVNDGGTINVLHGNWSSRVRITSITSSTGKSIGSIKNAAIGYGDVSKFSTLVG